MMKLIRELDNGQFYEKTNPKSLSDKYYLKISPSYALQVGLYPTKGKFIIGKDRFKVDPKEMVYPLTLIRGKAYRSNPNGVVQVVAQGYR